MGAKASMRRLERFAQMTVATTNNRPDEDKFVRCLLDLGGCRLLNRMARLPGYGLSHQSGVPQCEDTLSNLWRKRELGEMLTMG